MAITFQQLRYLVAVAGCGSLTEAARSLGVTQPVLSRALSTLQREVGAPLVKRRDRRLVLTAQGEAAIAPAYRALIAVEEVRQAAARRSPALRLNIAAQYGMPGVLATILQQFQQDNPETLVNIVAANSDEEMAERLASDQIDLVFGERVNTIPHACWNRFQTAEMVLASPPGLCLPDEVEAHDIAHVRLLSPPLSTSRQRVLDDLFLRAGLRPNIVLETEDMTPLIAMVRAGLGSIYGWRFNFEPGSSVVLRPFKPRLTAEIGFTWIDRRKPQVRDFIALAKGAPMARPSQTN